MNSIVSGVPTTDCLFVKTPLRISLGGGTTDIPSYYSRYGGFIFGVSISLYVCISIERLRSNRNIRFSGVYEEEVSSLDEVENGIGREALKMVGIEHSVSITSSTDSVIGSGIGSSGSYSVGLLNGLYTLARETKNPDFLAEKAFEISSRLGWCDGKQDPYLAAYGGFLVLHISTDGSVKVTRPNINRNISSRFLKNTLLFFSGVKRSVSGRDILVEHDRSRVFEMKHAVKDIGNRVLKAFEDGDLDKFGILLDQHWQMKKMMSDKTSSDQLDSIYGLARSCGALGGKLMGAGGGGYFIFYCPTSTVKKSVIASLESFGLQRINFGIDYNGSTVER